MTQGYVTQHTLKQLVAVVNWVHELLKLLPVDNYLYLKVIHEICVLSGFCTV
jgi:hypothetical protein